MAITVHVRELAQRAGIENASQLAKAAELYVETAYGYWEGTVTRFDASVLNKLCRFLKVPVGQLIEYIPDDETRPARQSRRIR